MHITLVIHPRKEDDPSKISISSIFGTAKSTQEADSVVIIKNTKIKDGDEPSLDRVLDIRKNRFSGHTGRVELEFDPERLLLLEPHSPMPSFDLPVDPVGKPSTRTSVTTLKKRPKPAPRGEGEKMEKEKKEKETKEKKEKERRNKKEKQKQKKIKAEEENMQAATAPIENFTAHDIITE